MKTYNIFIKGNDTFTFAHDVEAPNIVTALLKGNVIMESLKDVTIEKLEIVSIKLLED